MKINYAKLASSLALCLGVGLLGSIFTVSSISSWYALLNKPVFSPPNYLFGPVWTILYILIGISFYLVWMSDAKDKNRAFQIFFTQLFLNFVWSVVFFGLHGLASSLIVIFALWFVIVLNIRAFYRISKNAGYLLVPYLLWVSFATVLNLAIVILN